MSFIGANILQESARRKHTRRIPKIVQNPNPGGRIPFRGDPSWLGVSKHKNRSISFNKMLFWTDEISDIKNSENASPILSTLFLRVVQNKYPNLHPTTVCLNVLLDPALGGSGPEIWGQGRGRSSWTDYDDDDDDDSGHRPSPAQSDTFYLKAKNKFCINNLVNELDRKKHNFWAEWLV